MKKFISFLLAAVLLVSAVPTAMATNNYDQGTLVEYTGSTSEAYTITVPAQLAPGGNGTVTLEGTWPSNKTITVVAQKTVTLTNNINSDDKKTLNVNFDGIEAAGNNTTSQKIEQTVSVAAMPADTLFGIWSGHFYYTVGATTEDVPPSENYIGTVSADNTITLSGVEAAGTYTLRYANSNGALENYADICSLEVTDPATAVSYDDLIAENCAPVEATSIAVYNASNEKVGDIALGSLATNLGTKLYSFGALADIHIGSNAYSGTDKANAALTYLTETEKVDFVCIPGDLTENASDADFTSLQTVINNYSSTPIYVSTGNHDTPYYRGTNDISDEFLETYTGNPLYYSFTQGNDVFIMLGLNDGQYENAIFADGELEWLRETLEANKDKRCFIFQHVFPYDEDCGNAGNFYELDIWGGVEEVLFENLLSHYTNVLFFHGHSHTIFDGQTITETANYSNSFGSHSIHIPSVSKPRDLTGEYKDMLGEGYTVDVYENGVVLRGIDFAEEQYLPIAQYCIDTTIQPTADNGVIVPIDIDWQYGIKLDKTTGAESTVSYDGTSVTSTYSASQMIPVEDGATYMAGVMEANWTCLSICCYDESGNYIGYMTNVINGPADNNYVTMETEFEPLAGTAFIRLRLYSSISSEQTVAQSASKYWFAKVIY